MKRLTEGAHQSRDDLTVANALYSWHAVANMLLEFHSCH